MFNFTLPRYYGTLHLSRSPWGVFAITVEMMERYHEYDEPATLCLSIDADFSCREEYDSSEICVKCGKISNVFYLPGAKLEFLTDHPYFCAECRDELALWYYKRKSALFDSYKYLRESLLIDIANVIFAIVFIRRKEN